jgi:hypothetical protein
MEKKISEMEEKLFTSYVNIFPEAYCRKGWGHGGRETIALSNIGSRPQSIGLSVAQL